MEAAMTIDLRQPGPSEVAAGRPPSSILEPGQRIVLLTLYGSAFAFFLAGVWLLLADQKWLAPDIAPMFGFVLIVTAVSDVLAVFVLKRLWSRRTGRRT
jgi:hypothetical protein